MKRSGLVQLVTRVSQRRLLHWQLHLQRRAERKSQSTVDAMFLRVYSFLVLTYDVIALFFFVVKAAVESLYYIIFPPELKNVGKEIVLIAGAGHGLGRSLCYQFAMLGATVVCCDINTQSNEETAETAETLGYGIGHAYAYTCDISNREKVIAMAEKIKVEVGNVTIIINCCNLPSPRVLIEHPVPEIRKIMDVGVLSHLWILQAFLPAMQKNKHGHIVMMSSVAGLSGMSDLVPLSAAQFAVQGLAESLNEELRNFRTTGDVKLTLVHIYPFIVSSQLATSAQLRIPSYFGTIEPETAAKLIIEAMRRDYIEVSIPGYLLYVGKLVSILPRKAIFAMRELLNTGIDFG